MGGRDGLFSSASFYSVVLLSSCGAVHEVDFNHCLPVQQRGFPEEGFALPAPPLLFFFETAVVTFRRRLTRTYFGINEASLLPHELTPIRVDPSLISVPSFVHLLPIVRVPVLYHYSQTSSLVLQGFRYRRLLSRGNAAYDFEPLRQ